MHRKELEVLKVKINGFNSVKWLCLMLVELTNASFYCYAKIYKKNNIKNSRKNKFFYQLQYSVYGSFLYVSTAIFLFFVSPSLFEAKLLKAI